MQNRAVRSIALWLLAAGCLPYAASQSTVGTVTLTQAAPKGVAIMGSNPHPSYTSIASPVEKPDYDLVRARRLSIANLPDSTQVPTPSALSVPAPWPNPIVSHAPNVAFAGLSTVDNANANGNVVTPPDQGLCAGHGYVMEAINSTLAVYSEKGAQLTTPESVNGFFGADPATTFLSDPRCYYDAPTQRWFLSMTNVLNFVTGRSNLVLAVSQTSDPTGAYSIYSIDTTDDGLDGTPANSGCTTASPCFGDQPTLGADFNGVYLTTNEFGVFSGNFNGAQVYALSKTLLESGATLALVHIGNLPLAEGIAYSIQPASSPDLRSNEDSGVEYFLSALDFTGTLDNRVAVWALNNTRSLAQPTPTVSLMNVILTSEVYGQPAPVVQKPGPFPLGQSLGEPEEMIDSGDDRMQNVVFADGQLWGGLDTIVSNGKSINSGIAYFVVIPEISDNGLRARVLGQSYISVAGNSAIYPGIGVTSDGTAAAAFTVAGPTTFPSAAYASLNPFRAGPINIVAAGAAPQDDFSGYKAFGGGGVARWGDYSWGVADGNSLWLATEYIPGGINSVDFFTDFGTYVYSVNQD